MLIIIRIVVIDLMLGRAVAYLKGDGYVGPLAKRDSDVIIEFSSIDKDMFRFFVRFITSRFRKCGFIRTRMRKNVSFIFRTKRKDILLLFRKYAPYGTYKWRINQRMSNESRKFKKDFIVGFIEAEGYIDTYTGRITIYSSNLAGLKDLKKLLEEFGISSGFVGPYAGAYRLLIYGKLNLAKILGFGFCCKRKEKLLRTVLYHK